jgi:branched-chain amino acid transport system substrate-binding protein
MSRSTIPIEIRIIAFVATLGLLASACQPAAAPAGQAGPIKVGGIFDLTGATSDVGAAYADGVKAYVEFLNESGGVNGRQVQLISDDYAYQIPKAEELYNRLVTQENVIAIMGWGTGDTTALTPKVTRDKKPFMSASYAEDLVTDVSRNPYNFMIGTTYSDQARILLRYIKDNWKESRLPRVSMSFSDTPFGRAPVEDAKAFMRANGIEEGPDIIVALNSLDMTPQLLAAKSANPDFIIMNHTQAPTAKEAQDAKQAGLEKTVLGTLNWGTGEKTIELAGPAADGMLGVLPFAFIHEDLPGLKEIKDFNEKRGKDWKTLPTNYVQGWVSMKVMAEGIKRVQGDVTGESLKRALETIKDYDTGGITDTITFSDKSHKGSLAARIFKADASANKWVEVASLTQASSQ